MFIMIQNLKKNLVKQVLNSGFSKEDANKIKVISMQCKKVVIKHYKRYIDTTVGFFEIEADSKILRYFYNVGIGSRKSIGFGMIDLLKQDQL